jgi:predicted transcriptional regulator
MEVHLNPDLQAKLTRIAAARGSNAEMLAREAIERFVDYDEWFIHEVEKGLASADRGGLLSHEEVCARQEKRLARKAVAAIDGAPLVRGSRQ